MRATHESSASRFRRVGRPLAAAMTLGLVPGLVLTAGPAMADVPVGWAEPDQVSALSLLLVLFIIPVICIVTIAVLAAAPAIIKGEPILPTPHDGDALSTGEAKPELNASQH